MSSSEDRGNIAASKPVTERSCSCPVELQAGFVSPAFFTQDWRSLANCDPQDGREMVMKDLFGDYCMLLCMLSNYTRSCHMGTICGPPGECHFSFSPVVHYLLLRCSPPLPSILCCSSSSLLHIHFQSSYASVLTFVPFPGNFALNSTYGWILLSVPGHVC